MANAKVTVAENFALVKAFLEQNGASQEMVDFIVDRAEKSVRKRSDKPSAKQVENEGIKDIILATLTSTPMTISDIQKSNAELSDLSGQKMSALLKQLVDTNKVNKTYDKKTPLFSI